MNNNPYIVSIETQEQDNFSMSSTVFGPYTSHENAIIGAQKHAARIAQTIGGNVTNRLGSIIIETPSSTVFWFTIRELTPP